MEIQFWFLVGKHIKGGDFTWGPYPSQFLNISEHIFFGCYQWLTVLELAAQTKSLISHWLYSKFPSQSRASSQVKVENFLTFDLCIQMGARKVLGKVVFLIKYNNCLVYHVLTIPMWSWIGDMFSLVLCLWISEKFMFSIGCNV